MIRRPPRSTLFPTRRSSDPGATARPRALCQRQPFATPHRFRDRKSTRLNSSHITISYAVFCLKKKKKTKKSKTNKKKTKKHNNKQCLLNRNIRRKISKD